jgi:hypothetical protein
MRFGVRLLIAAYLVETGLLLIVAPWTAFWQNNYFGWLLPALGQFMLNEFTRGAVTGIGLITTFAGLRDLSAAISARNAARTSPESQPR